MVSMAETRMKFTKYDGCGKCLLATRRLSRDNEDTSNSPDKQWNKLAAAARAYGGHIIGCADDWETSGATDPYTRPNLGPWLRDEMGPFDGVVASAVDRLGRNQPCVLATGYALFGQGKVLLTSGHDGPWNLRNRSDQILFSMQSLSAEMELWAIQDRITDTKVNNRAAGIVSGKNSYGYIYVRVNPKIVDHVSIDDVAHEILLEMADRIMTCDVNDPITVFTECRRLSLAGVLCPSDHRAVMYGREPKRIPWDPRSTREILVSQATLGYLMHKKQPVLSVKDKPHEYAPGIVTEPGEPIRIAPPLWTKDYHDALVEKLEPKVDSPLKGKPRAARTDMLVSMHGFCGQCGTKVNINANNKKAKLYRCEARSDGYLYAQDCKPAPHILAEELDSIVTDWFLTEYGDLPLFKEVFDAGTSHAARIAELVANKDRLQRDRAAGIYDEPEDEARFYANFKRISSEIAQFKSLPQRAAGHHWIATGETPGDIWRAAPDNQARRRLLSNYGVRVEIFPVSSRHERVWIHGLDPQAETTARIEEAAGYQRELEEYAEASRALAESPDLAAEQEEAAEDAAEAYQAATTPTVIMTVDAEEVLQLAA
jgi:site-specific DNA recombinase